MIKSLSHRNPRNIIVIYQAQYSPEIVQIKNA